MKGKATFTLADAKTGRTVRQFTEHNIVTNAVKRILEPPPYAMISSFSWSDFLSAALPLYKTLFGGIMLLGNNVTESADNIMPSPDFIPVATAGDAYSGALATRGSLNLNESYEMENGYHFTWDFGTDKANGTIKCAALTSRIFGNSGFGSDEKTGGLLLNPSTLKVELPRSQYCKASGQYICSIGGCRHIYYSLNSDMTLTFSIVKSLDPTSVGINDSSDLTNIIKPESNVTVTLPIELDSRTKPFYDSSAGILYFFSVQYSEEETYYIDYAGVKLNNFSVTEKKTCRLAEKHSYMHAAALYNGSLFFADGSYIYVYSSSGIQSAAFEMDMSIEVWFYMVNDVLYLNTYSGISWLWNNGRFIVNVGTGLYGLGTDSSFQPPYYPEFVMYRPGGIKAAVSINPYLCLAANYLATINNLSEPLVKTSEHTLKITYDITN